MAGKTVLSDGEGDEIEVEQHERKEPDEDAVDPEEDEEAEDEFDNDGFTVDDVDEDEQGAEEENRAGSFIVDEFEKDGFTVDDVDEDDQDAEEENRADSDNERQKKKKKKKRKSEKNYVLDEEDYELIQDKNITHIRRSKAESNKFKRLKKANADADEGQSGFSHAKLKCHLFWDNEDPPLEDIGEEYQLEEDDGFCEGDSPERIQEEDPYYQENHDDSKKRFKSRRIVHPHFQNITADEAIWMLSDKEPGESIIRPSFRGPSFLTLTLKIYDNVYTHKDIIEGGKENKDITSMLRLGKTLKIGEDVFEDLDEVMDLYVDPLVTNLKKMLAYGKFKDGEIAEVDESIRKEKLENPSRIAYSFSVCHEYPGLFILTYIRSSDPHHEYVGLDPKGFKFRDKMFEDIDKLVIDLMVTCC